MAIPRPLNKDLLKRMFLVTLHEHKRSGGRWSQNGSDCHTILTLTLRHQFGIDELTTEELATARRAIFELEQHDYIAPGRGQNGPEFKELTERGRKAVQQRFEDMRLPSVDIDELLTHDDLRAKVREDYVSGDYDSAVLKAFKMVEEKVRIKSGQPAAVVGVNLMTAAFKSGGVLQHPEAQVDAEREALHQLFRGAIGWFKNPQSHRTVGLGDAHQAAHTLAFANLLLDLTDQC
jgi:uncharacterized protein (TIGR02391 family)